MTAKTASKPSTKTATTAAERLEQAIQRADRIKEKINQAYIDGKPTADLRAAYNDAFDAISIARDGFEAERQAEAEAARQAERERLQPQVEAMMDAVRTPIQARIEQGFTIAAPELPEIRDEWAVKTVQARERLAAIEQEAETARARAAELAGRIERIQAERCALIARRAQGDTRDDDAAQLALMDADLEALAPMAATARTETEQAESGLREARTAVDAAVSKWDSEKRRATAEFYEALAKRVEVLLGDCFAEQRKGQQGYWLAPMFYDDRVRAVAGMGSLMDRAA